MTETKLSADFDHFLPNFCEIRIVFGVVLVSQFLALLLQFASGPAEYGFWSELGLKSLFILWVALISTAALCRIRPLIQGVAKAWCGLFVFCVIQISALLFSWLAKDLLPAHGITFYTLSKETDAAFYLRNLGISCLIGIAFLHYLQVTHDRNRRIKAASEARMMAMQSRTRPHFLYNSLNTIASLIRVDSRLAEDLIQDLAELYRAILRADRKVVSLEEELHLAKQYLNIELQRLDRRLKVQWDVDRAPKDARIPPLILQPLIENAVIHGVESSLNGGNVAVVGEIRKDTVVLTVKNSLSNEQAKKAKRGNRIAVNIIEARLQTCFPEEGKILISSFDDSYQVRLFFPYMKDSS